MGLKNLLKWENSVESTKISRSVKFSSQMQISVKYTEKTEFKRLPACEWRTMIGLGIPENTGMGYSAYFLLAQRFLKPNVSSQTNNFHARADSKPPDWRSEKEETLIKHCFARSSACLFPEKHTHAGFRLGHTNVVQVANLYNFISFLHGKVMQCSFTDFMPSHALNQQQMRSRT